MVTDARGLFNSGFTTEQKRLGVFRTILFASPVIILPGAVVLVLWWAGLFDPATSSTGTGGTSSSAQLAAALGVVGVSITAAGALVAVLIRQSVDIRNHQLAIEAASRERESLRIQEVETVMRAVELLAGDAAVASENKSSMTRASGAILALGSLGQVRLAITLLYDLWPRGHVSSTAVDDVVERSFKQPDEETKRLAVQLLFHNVDKLDVAPGFWIWPQPLQSWDQSLVESTRVMVVGVLDQWLEVKEPESEDDFRLQLLADASKDPAEEVRTMAFAALARRRHC